MKPAALFFLISSKGSFIFTDRIVHTMAFVTSVVERWLKQEIAQWVHHQNVLSAKKINNNIFWVLFTEIKSYNHKILISFAIKNQFNYFMACYKNTPFILIQGF